MGETLMRKGFRLYFGRRRATCCIVCAILAFSLTIAPKSQAQRDGAGQAAPAVLLDTDVVAAKMLGAARDFLGAQQWGDAVELLRQIADQHGERLVAIDSGRFVNVQTYADILISSMPPEGLKLYRARIDPQARRWFEAGKRGRDEASLERVAHKAFLSSYGDEALLLLGEIAWEQGALARARSYWEKLIPTAASSEPGRIPPFLKYPDSEIDPAQVRARLILCSLMQGNLARAQTELDAFRDVHAQAAGTIAGRAGKLAPILADLLAESQAVPLAPADAETSTFAGNSQRSQLLPSSVDVGGISWSIPIKETRVERTIKPDDSMFDRFERIDRWPAVQPIDVLSYYPVAWKNIGFYCDDTEIFACELTADRAGKPAWGDENSIYKLPAELDPRSPGSRARAGLPRFTLSIDGHWLFARLGTMAAPAGRNRGFHPTASVLVCLDLARQGDLTWMIKAEDIEVDGGKWVFDGAPVAADGRIYAGLRRNDPQLQLGVACFDASSAKLLWHRKVCGGVESFSGDVDEVRHQLLTLAEERLYFCTNLGAVASLDARDGAMRWVATYPRVEAETIQAFNKRQQHGPNPCVFHDGLVLAAPTDGDRVLAFDAETGILKWDHELNGKVNQLLGVAGTRLIVAGDLLWAIDVETGKVQWREGRTDPEAATWGRGVLAGDLIYWPRREEIRLVEISTGAVRRQIELAEQYGLTGGGNLMIAGGRLVLAQSDRLVVFSPFGALKKPALNELALRRGIGH